MSIDNNTDSAEISSEKTPAEKHNESLSTQDLSTSPSGRKFQLYLGNMRGVLLGYLYEGKILAFFGGSARVRLETPEGGDPSMHYACDITVTPAHLLAAMRGETPEVVSDVHHRCFSRGDKHTDTLVKFEEIPYVTTSIREAAGLSRKEWGSGDWIQIKLMPVMGQAIVNNKLNNTNVEDYLDNNWHAMTGMESVVGSGSGDFASRLHPLATKVAQDTCTAWWIAASSCILLGGRSNVPNLPMKMPPAQKEFHDFECRQQVEKRRERVQREMERRSGQGIGNHEGFSLGSNPEIVKKMHAAHQGNT